MRHHHRGHGVNRRLLDPAARGSGGGRHPCLPGQLQTRQACARTQVRRERLPVVAVSAFGRIAAGLISTRKRNPRHPRVEPSPLQSDRDSFRPRAAYAQGAYANESANSSRAQRHHRTQRYGHHRSHRGWRALAGSAGRSMQSTRALRPGDGHQVAGRQLPLRAPVHPQAVADRLQALSGTDSRLRPGNRAAHASAQRQNRSSPIFPCHTTRPQIPKTQQKTSFASTWGQN